MTTIEGEHSIARILEEVRRASPYELYAYYCGASRDGCWSRAHRTFRITQKDRSWLEMLHHAIARQGRKAGSTERAGATFGRSRPDYNRIRTLPSREANPHGWLPSLGGTSMQRAESHDRIKLAFTSNLFRKTR